MSVHRKDEDLIARTHNTARFFVENKHISWVLLVATLVWGVTAIPGCLSAKILIYPYEWLWLCARGLG